MCTTCAHLVSAVAILNTRKGMWEKVAKRSHKPMQIYPFGARSDDVMLYGTVDYVLRDDKKTSTSWAARAHFAEEDGQLKMDFYQVFLVSDRAVYAPFTADRQTDMEVGHGGNGESKVISSRMKLRKRDEKSYFRRS